jgi:hypothetical protein
VKPLFSKKLLRTAADGTYASFSGSKRVAFWPDRVQLDGVAIHYAYITKLAAYGNVLHVGYRTSDGSIVEEYFRYDKLFKRRAASELSRAVAEATLFCQSVAPSVVEQVKRQLPATPRAAGRIEQSGRTAVAVSATGILFPLKCPTCEAPADTVTLLHASRGFGHRTAWVVPTCERHPELKGSVKVNRWHATRSGAELSFASPSYAEEFRKLNEGTAAGSGSTLLGWEVDRGTRFVVFNTAISAIYVALLITSRVHKISPGENVGLRHWRNTLISLLVGWWSIPGILYTIRALTTNFRGGIDITPSVKAVVSRQAANPASLEAVSAG